MGKTKENRENKGKQGKARESKGEDVVCMCGGKCQNFARTVRRR